MKDTTRVGVAFFLTLVIPFIVAGVSYPLIGEWASLLSVLVTWGLLTWGTGRLEMGVLPAKKALFGSIGTALLFRVMLIGLGALLLHLEVTPTPGPDITGAGLVALITSALGAGWFEERFFRGRALLAFSDMGKAGSAIMSSTMFALLHYPLSANQFPATSLLTLFLFGLLMSFLRFKFNSVWVSVFAHLSFNLSGLALLLFA